MFIIIKNLFSFLKNVRDSREPRGETTTTTSERRTAAAAARSIFNADRRRRDRRRGTARLSANLLTSFSANLHVKRDVNHGPCFTRSNGLSYAVGIIPRRRVCVIVVRARTYARPLRDNVNADDDDDDTKLL